MTYFNKQSFVTFTRNYFHQKAIVIYSTREEDKAFVHANCVFSCEQVNESGLTLECCI
jgi:hypothetical protein